MEISFNYEIWNFNDLQTQSWMDNHLQFGELKERVLIQICQKKKSNHHHHYHKDKHFIFNQEVIGKTILPNIFTIRMRRNFHFKNISSLQC